MPQSHWERKMKFYKFVIVLVASLLLGGISFSADSHASKGKRNYFELKYTATIKDLPEKDSRIRIWIPYPKSDAYQRIFSLKIDSPYPTYVHEDPQHSTRYLYIETQNLTKKEIVIKFKLLAERYEIISQVDFHQVGEYVPGNYPEADYFLQNNYDTTTNPNEINRIVSRILKNKKTYMDKVKAIYDYVYDNMTYSKDIEGYGTGNVSRACKVRSGNCIDFHSLFIALATAAGIPSREVANIDLPFEEGVPNYCKANYHCNVEVFLPNYGWFPLDISHAKKGKGSKEYYFGSLDNLRLKLGHGRNLLLSPPQQGPRLTRLLHNPYVEVDGKPHSAVQVSVLASIYDPSKYIRRRELIAAGEKAIPFVATDVNGQPFDLNEYIGKVPIFINFFTTWCGRCIWESEEINKAHEEFNDILFIRINFTESKEKVVKFAKKYNIPFTVLLDEEGEICNLYGIKYVPTNVLINRDGVVTFSGGFFTGEDLRSRLEQLSHRRRNES